MHTISRDDLKQMNEQQHRDFVLINVLAPEAFNERHIRTSVNVPVDDAQFAARVAALAGNKDREIVVYCASAECNASPKASAKLEQAGFTRVFDYEGGTADWFAHH